LLDSQKPAGGFYHEEKLKTLEKKATDEMEVAKKTS